MSRDDHNSTEDLNTSLLLGSLTGSAFQEFDVSICCDSSDNEESIQPSQVSEIIERDLNNILHTSVQNRTVNEFIDDVFEDSNQWRHASIFNNATTASEIQAQECQHEEIDLLPSDIAPAAGPGSPGIDVKLDDSDVEFECDDLYSMKFETFDNNVGKSIEKIGSGSNEGSAFHELPDKIKMLILKIKNIGKLYDWQEECLRLNSVMNRRNLIYALPTSGGKTLVAEILMLREIMCNKRNAIFILPFVAIVQEKIQSMAPFAVELDFLVEEYAGSKGVYPPLKRRRKNSLYVCTNEKALGLINSLTETGRLKEVGMIVVDELHLLGEDGGRGATLEGLLTKLIYMNADIHIVGMSATIGNLNEVAEFLRADVYTQNFRPVELKEYMKCGDSIWLIDTREEDIFTDEKKVNYQYSKAAQLQDPDKIGGLVMDVVPKDSILIFCPTKKNCESVALLMTRVLFRSLVQYKAVEKQKLMTALKAEGDLCPILSKTIKYGVAYHHSGLTNEERKLVEDAYREGTLSVICCTSTLAAGVNLPARRVILRKPYVGNEFLNLSRYKQMVGRAGRAGMGEVGESIILCGSSEIPKVRAMLTSKMDDCLSSLHTQEDRGLKNLLLSSVMLSIASNRAQLHKLVSTSLLGIQSTRLNVNIKEIVDKAIVELIHSRPLKVKELNDDDPIVNVFMLSQCVDDNIEEPKTKRMKHSIILSKDSDLELSTLGKAAMKGSIDLQTAYYLQEDLKSAQNHLVLSNELHILYLVTPYDVANQVKPELSVMSEIIISLPPPEMSASRVLGFDETAVMKLRNGIIPKRIKSRILYRFYVTLMLYDLRAGQSIYAVAEKYKVSRGITQNLVSSAASFAVSVVKFCQEMPEFWVFSDLFKTFSKKLMRCYDEELVTLMELPAVKIGRARQLYDAGFKTLQSIASAKPHELLENLKYVSRKTAEQMIATANLLLMEKVENLKDEYAEMMEDLQASPLP